MFPFKHNSSKCTRLSICRLPSWAKRSLPRPAPLSSFSAALPPGCRGRPRRRPHVVDLALGSSSSVHGHGSRFQSRCRKPFYSETASRTPRLVCLRTPLAPLLAAGVPDEKEPRLCDAPETARPPCSGAALRASARSPGAPRFPPPAGGAARKGRDGNFGAVLIWIFLTWGSRVSFHGFKGYLHFFLCE